MSIVSFTGHAHAEVARLHDRVLTLEEKMARLQKEKEFAPPE